jgi:hypothetical protein
MYVDGCGERASPPLREGQGFLWLRKQDIVFSPGNNTTGLVSHGAFEKPSGGIALLRLRHAVPPNRNEGVVGLVCPQ